MRSSLIKIRVSGLFDRFNHEIPITRENRVTVVHAPNGFGKTVVLRIIHSFFKSKFASLAGIPFSSVYLYFSDGRLVKLTRKTLSLPLPTGGTALRSGLTIALVDNNDRTIHEPWTHRPAEMRISGGMVDHLDDLVPGLRRISPTLWMDSDGAQLNLESVLEKYGTLLPEEWGKVQVPGWVTELTHTFECRFIETQRLLDLRPVQPGAGRWSRSGPAGYRAVVDTDAQDLVARIKAARDEYLVISQKLDPSFPRRLIEQADTSEELDEEDLRKQIDALDQERSRLVNAGLVDQTYHQPLPMKTIDDRILGVLQVYLQDGRDKFRPFEDIYKKIDTFTRILNQRFMYKRVEVNKEEGIRIVSTQNRKPLPLQSLSSGEQHELVLLYELLFQMQSGTLLLIDEPEISLHVGWQKQFLPDLLSIAELSDLTVLVATHSPQIINDRWDLTVELTGQGDD